MAIYRRRARKRWRCDVCPHGIEPGQRYAIAHRRGRPEVRWHTPECPENARELRSPHTDRSSR